MEKDTVWREILIRFMFQGKSLHILTEKEGGGGGGPLVAQWLRSCLAMQGTQVQSLVRDPRSPVPWSDEACTPRMLGFRHN